MRKGLDYQIFAAIMVIFCLAAADGCKRESKIPTLAGEKDYNLLVITLDTTRADRIGIYGYPHAETPNIDRLAQEGVMFENCYASVPLTLPSHATLMTGREPVAHHVRNNGTYVLKEDETTLAEIMQDHGFLTHAVIASFVLHSKFGLSQGFGFFDDSLDFSTAANNMRTEIDAAKVYSKFNSWFEKNHTKRFFSWVHFYDPHTPYSPPPEYKEKFSSDFYDGEIAYVDHFVGEIINDLKSKQVLNKTLIIIVGDHGEAFGEHKEHGHGIFCYEESIKVPLVFSSPAAFKEKSRVISQRICLADIMPTVLQLFGWDIPDNIQGKSLAPLLFGEEEEKEIQIYIESMFGKEDMGWAPLTGMIFNNFKFVSLPIPELYDLAKDPMEEQNLFNQKNSLAKKIDEKLREYIQSHSESDTPARRALTAADREKMESLGYISPFSEKSKKSIDPKEGIDLLNEVLSVKKMFEEGKADDAEKKLSDLLSTNQGIKIPQLYDNLANMHKDRGDLDSAIQVLEKAVEQFPEKERFRMNLALFYLGVGRNDDAEQMCQALIKENSSVAQAYSLLGLIYKGRGENDKAVSFYKKAKQIEPLNVLLQVNYAEAELERGNHSAAIQVLDSLLKHEVLMNDRDSARVRIRMGILLARAGDYDRAISLFLRIIGNKNANAEVWTHLGLSYFKKGDFQKALESYNQSMELDDKNALTLSSLGTLNLSLFRIEKKRDFHTRAIDYYERALDADSGMASAYNGLAIAYKFESKNELAVSLWKKTIEIKPDFTNAYINLGITLITMRQKEEALKYLTICREKYFSRLNTDDQKQLLELIEEAEEKGNGPN